MAQVRHVQMPSDHKSVATMCNTAGLMETGTQSQLFAWVGTPCRDSSGQPCLHWPALSCEPSHWILVIPGSQRLFFLAMSQLAPEPWAHTGPTVLICCLEGFRRGGELWGTDQLA